MISIYNGCNVGRKFPRRLMSPLYITFIRVILIRNFGPAVDSPYVEV